jgi:uncharacterized protein
MAKDTPARKKKARQPAAPEMGSREATPVRSAPGQTLVIGVLSDTHGYLDPEVPKLFAGVAHIVHAGDVMDADILRRLEGIAPVTAVAGNLDRPEDVGDLPREVVVEIEGVRVAVGHKPKRLLKRLRQGKLEADGLQLVIWGHEHVPSAAWIEGVLHLNPGTASAPDEEDDGPTVALVERTEAGLSVRFVPLADRRI